jgi:phage/plasmid-like protein (TIGR03299 family)
MNSQELLIASKTDWTVSKRPLFGPNGEETPGFGIFRDDVNHCLGLVGSKYTITQNQEVLEMLMDAAGSVNIPAVRGGALGKGERIYYQFQLPEVTIGGSKNLRYLTGLTAHDGLTKIGFGATNVVVICQNTFFQAFKDCEAVKHTPNHKEKLQGIIKSLKESLFAEEHMIERMIKLSTTTVPSKIDDNFLFEIIGGHEESTRSTNRLNDLKAAMSTEYTSHGETAYGLFNAVTRFTNHMTPYKDLDTKRKALMFGAGARINAKAFDLIESKFVTSASAEIYI